MNGQVGQSQRATQNRVIALFRDEYLGDWTDRGGNRTLDLLTQVPLGSQS